MYRFSYSEEKNRIYIYVEGKLSQEDVQNYIDEMLTLIDGTKPGFTVLADSSKSDISFFEISTKFHVIRDYGNTKGFKNVATVLSEEAYNLHEINPFPGIKNTFRSLKEAADFLDLLI